MKDKAAVFGWNIIDEPEFNNRTPEDVRQLDQNSKAADPQHPTYYTAPRPEAVPHYLNTGDIVGGDIYRFNSAPGTIVYQSMLRLCADTKANPYYPITPIGVTQTHKWSGDTTTPARLRNCAWQALCGGVKGLNLFTWNLDAFFVRNDPNLWAQVERLPGEVARMQRYFIDGELTHPAASNTGVVTALWSLGGARRLAVLNTSTASTSVTVTQATSSLAPLFTTRPGALASNGSTLTGTLNAEEVCVYDLSAVAAPSVTVQFSAASQMKAENGGPATVTVSLSAASAQSVTVPFTVGGTAASGTDYTISPSSEVTIPAGATSASITITPVNDPVCELPNETVVLTLGPPVAPVVLGATAVHTLSITDDAPVAVADMQADFGVAGKGWSYWLVPGGNLASKFPFPSTNGAPYYASLSATSILPGYTTEVVVGSGIRVEHWALVRWTATQSTYATVTGMFRGRSAAADYPADLYVRVNGGPNLISLNIPAYDTTTVRSFNVALGTLAVGDTVDFLIRREQENWNGETELQAVVSTYDDPLLTVVATYESEVKSPAESAALGWTYFRALNGNMDAKVSLDPTWRALDFYYHWYATPYWGLTYGAATGSRGQILPGDLENWYVARWTSDVDASLLTVTGTLRKIHNFVDAKQLAVDLYVRVNGGDERSLRVLSTDTSTHPYRFDFTHIKVGDTVDLMVRGEVRNWAANVVLNSTLHAVLTVPSSMQSWLEKNALPADGSSLGGPDASPAGDGIKNLMKFALGIDPWVTGYQNHLERGTVAVSNKDYLTLTYMRPEPPPAGVICTVKTSSDLVTWSANETVPVSSPVADGIRTITVRDSISTQDAPQRFIRLEVNPVP